MFNTMIPKVFNAKHKALNTHIKEYIDNINYSGKSKYYPPLVKEWFNGIYAYNKNTVKILPSLDKNIIRLIKGYFNLYNLQLTKKARSKRFRARNRRSSTNRLLVSKPDLKHMNDRIIVTAYVYNRRKKYYINKIKKTSTLDCIKKYKFINSIEKFKKKKFRIGTQNWKVCRLIIEKSYNEQTCVLTKTFQQELS